jgi:hypothetical protein
MRKHVRNRLSDDDNNDVLGSTHNRVVGEYLWMKKVMTTSRKEMPTST